MRKLLNWIKKTYNDPDILITENGWSDAKSWELDDDERIGYYRDYVNNVMKAILLDEVKVLGYTAWSFMDNFEWGNGYKYDELTLVLMLNDYDQCQRLYTHHSAVFCSFAWI